MTVDAAKIQYRDEFIAGFEERQSLLRNVCVTEAVINGNQATFLVADSNSGTAVTRGVDGQIPYLTDSESQLTATLAEWHAPYRKTGFNIFASQGDQRRIMQMNSMAVINRKIDADIIAQLDTATIDTGTSTTADVALVATALAALGYAEVPVEEMDNLFGLITPGFMAYLMQTKEFASKEYVDVTMFNGAVRKMLRWYGINWIQHPNLTGAQTSTEKCYLFHRNALGHAVNSKGMDVKVDYNDEQDYSWSRCSIFMGSKLLQNTGIVQMKHDGSAFSLS